jgi:hypothetical protein
MNNEEAKFILSAYRPSGKDSMDPQMQAALDLARRNPAMDAWLRLEIKQDTEISTALRTTTVPPALRDQILAGEKVTAFSGKSRRIWTSWLPLIAAVLTIATTGSWLWTEQRPGQQNAPSSVVAGAKTAELAAWQKAVLTTLAPTDGTPMRFDSVSKNPEHLLSWLKARGNPVSINFSKSGLNLNQLASLGCKVINLNGQPVSIICFHLPDGKGEIHLAVADLKANPDAPKSGASPGFLKHGKWITASWAEGDHWVMLASEMKEADFKQLIL